MAARDNGGCSTITPTSDDDVFSASDKADLLLVKVKPMKGSVLELTAVATDTVEALKRQIEIKLNIAPIEQRLSKRGKRIESGTLASNGIKDKDVILLMQVPQARGTPSLEPTLATASSPNSPVPVRKPCSANCGFYGDPHKDDLCSRCFDEREKRLQDEQEELKAKERKAKEDAEAKAAAEREATRPKQLKPTRCFKCNIRVGPAIIKCRCGYGFCSKCRYPEQHECEFDYKAHDTLQLQNRLTQVKGDKMRDRT